MKKKLVLTLMILMFLYASPLFLVPSGQIPTQPNKDFSPAAGEWYAFFSHRKKFIHYGAVGAGTDYQLPINVTYESNMKSDFSDICFAGPLNQGGGNDTNLLDHWLESYVASSWALFWVEVNLNILGAQDESQFWIYYGNPTASSLSDGDATFLFFDDFNDGSINTTKWYHVYSDGATTESGGTLNIVADPAGWEGYGAKYMFGENHAFGMRVITSDDNKDTCGFGVDDRSDDGSYNGTGIDDAKFSFDDVTSTRREGNSETQAESISYTSYSVLEIKTFAASTLFYQDRVLENTHVTQVPTDDMGHMFTIKLSQTINIDWVYTRKCVATEPIFHSWLAEEANPYVGSWSTAGDPAPIIFYVLFDEWGMNTVLIILGLVMIPLSTMYLAYGVRHDRSSERLFYGLVILMLGFGLLIGGILP